VKAVKPNDVIYIPSSLATCPRCARRLFATIHRYFADTGEVIEKSIYVGCVNCDGKMGKPILSKVRPWVCSNYRVKG